MPGYEVHFADPLDKSFECPVCWNALRSPVQVTPCGHRVCQSCLEPIMRNRNPKCPMDNLPLNGEKVFPDNGCLRQILSLMILCKRNSEGCEWSGPLSEEEDHENECGYVDIECPNSCGEMIKKREVESHNNECIFREEPCEYCHIGVTASQRNLHLETCPKLPVDCPWNCGARNMSREMLVLHKLRECSLSVLECKYSDAGCKFTAKRDEMDQHMETATKEHLALVHEKLLRQQKCLEAQTESIQLQKEHIKLQRDALNTYKNDLVELRSKFADGELIWKISQFSQKLKDTKTQRSPELLVSEPFYTHKNGYKMCAGLWVNGFGSGKGKYVSVGLQVIVGEYDEILSWPVNPRFTFTLLDQRENTKERRHITASFDPHWIARPTPERQLGKGARKFVLQSVACDDAYCKNDTIFIRFDANVASRVRNFIDA